jgi:hypothetical protein
MKLLYRIQLPLISLLVCLTATCITGDSPYRFWVWVGAPVLAIFAICEFFLFLRYRAISKSNEPKPVENEEIFDHLFIKKVKRQSITSKTIIYER